MVTLGSLASIGLGVYLLVGRIVGLLGNQAPLAYGLAVAFFLPIVLVLGERAAVSRGSGGLYNLVRGGTGIGLQYWTGWLLFGGYFLLGAVFAWAAGSVLADLIDLAFEIKVDSRLVAILLVLIISLLRVPDIRTSWRTKTIILAISFIFILALTFRLIFFPITVSPSSAYLPTDDALRAVPFIAIGLYGASFVLDFRDDVRRPQRRILAGLALPLLLSGGLGIIVAVMMLNYSGIVAANPLAPFRAIVSELNSVALVLVLLGSLLVALAGLNQTLTSESRLGRELILGGLVPEGLLTSEGGIKKSHLLPYPLIMILALLLLDLDRLVGPAAAMLLLAMALTTAQDLFQKQARLPEKRRFKLPLHPLFPLTAVVVSVTMAFSQPVENHLITFAWIIGGAIYFVIYGRVGAVAARQRGVIVSGGEFELEVTTQAVLVYVTGNDLDSSLIRVGATLAEIRNHPLLVLRVVEHEDGTQTEAEDNPKARAALAALHTLFNELAITGVHPTPIVRLAASPVEAILSTIWDERVATTVLGWPADEEESGLTSVEDIDYLVTRAPCEVAILQGKLPETIQNVVVPMTSVTHGPAALNFGRDLARPSGARVEALGFVRGHPNEEALAKARTYVQNTVNRLQNPAGIETDVKRLVKMPGDVVSAVKPFDLVLVGASDEGIIRPTTFQGLPADTVRALPQASLVIKKRESNPDYYIRQGWEWLFRILPKLERKDRALVYRGMQNNSRANIDFYVLIILSAGIAFLGLLLDSSSVIIGAMLIAPLMNPILAMAHGLVMGNMRMFWQAANSTLTGVIMAVGMSAFLALTLFALGAGLEPTNEILSRTSPNLLDLLVALLSGAAAAYAVSRSQLAGALPGVAIAAALVPPLCVVGYGVGTGQFDIAGGAALLFITNLAAITVAAAAVFLLLGFRPPVRIERGEQARHGLTVSLVVLGIVALVLVVFTYFSGQQANDRSTIESILNSALSPNQGSVENIQLSRDRHGYVADFTVLDYTGNFGDQDVYILSVQASAAVNEQVTMRASIVDSRPSVSDGSQAPQPTPTPSPSPTDGPRPELTRAPVVTPTAIPSMTVTIMPTITPTLIPSPTATIELTETVEPTSTPTETPQPTRPPIRPPTETPTIEATPTIMATPEGTSTPEATETTLPPETPLPTETPSPEETIEPTATPEPATFSSLTLGAWVTQVSGITGRQFPEAKAQFVPSPH
jgi:uncharacterized hydrophobic protein (TIGR00271 family)